MEVVYEQGMFHVWPLIDMPEARRARDRIVAFLRDERTGRAGTKRVERDLAVCVDLWSERDRNFGIEQDRLARISDRPDCHPPIDADPVISATLCGRTLKTKPRAGSQRPPRAYPMPASRGNLIKHQSSRLPPGDVVAAA